MANTFELIASSTVGSGGAANIDFTSIPSTYTDLCLKVSVRSSKVGSADGLAVKFNSATSTYSDKTIQGNGSTVSSFNNGVPSSVAIYADEINASTSTSSTFSNTDIYIPNYAGNAYKSVSIDGTRENNATSADAQLTAALWSNTAAITSITLYAINGNLVQYSTAYLYGVKNA